MSNPRKTFSLMAAYFGLLQYPQDDNETRKAREYVPQDMAQSNRIAEKLAEDRRNSKREQRRRRGKK